MNQLTVGPTSLGVRSNDTWLTSKVKTALINTKYVPSGTIAVTTDHSVVYLMGKLTQAGRLRRQRGGRRGRRGQGC